MQYDDDFSFIIISEGRAGGGGGGGGVIHVFIIEPSAHTHPLVSGSKPGSGLIAIGPIPSPEKNLGVPVVCPNPSADAACSSHAILSGRKSFFTPLFI